MDRRIKETSCLRSLSACDASSVLRGCPDGLTEPFYPLHNPSGMPDFLGHLNNGEVLPIAERDRQILNCHISFCFVEVHSA